MLLAATMSCLTLAAQESTHSASDSSGVTRTQIDSRWTRIRLLGTNTPSVILVSGIGDGLRAWALVQPQISPFAQVLAYDRPGLGGSDPSPDPRDVPHMAAELDRLLNQLKLAPPYVLVGHSLGGMIVEYYAVHYPTKVVAMVLVDPALAQFYIRADSLPAYREAWEANLRELSAAPPIVRAEFAQWEADLAAVAALGPRPMVPTVLLTSVHHGIDSALERLWLEEQRRWAQAHAGTRHVVDPTHGHRLQEETPDAVVDAVRSVLDEVRKGRRRPLKQ